MNENDNFYLHIRHERDQLRIANLEDEVCQLIVRIEKLNTALKESDNNFVALQRRYIDAANALETAKQELKDAQVQVEPEPPYVRTHTTHILDEDGICGICGFDSVKVVGVWPACSGKLADKVIQSAKNIGEKT